MARLSFLAYRRGDSLVHKMPAILKIVILCFVSIRLFSDSKVFFFHLFEKDFLFINTAVFIRTVFYSVLAIFFFICAGTPFSHLRKLFFVFVIGAFVFLFRCVDFASLQIIADEVPGGVLYIIRFFIAALMAMVMFETTTAVQILYSMEDMQILLSERFPFLRKSNLPLIIALAINFIPQIFEVWEQTRIAVKARTFGKRRGVVVKIKVLAAQFSCVVSCMLHRCDEIRKAVINRSYSQN